MMSGIRGKNTLPERMIRKGLFARGVRYRLHDRTLPGRPDIVTRKHRAVIFIHGCFWHAHDGCRFFKLPGQNRKFWKAKLMRNRERDAQAVRRLREGNWRVAIVWECSIRADAISVVDQLHSFLVSDLGFLEFAASNANCTRKRRLARHR